jgi:hypothetical protein
MKYYRELLAFVIERHNIYLRRAQGASKPWTKDPILQQYKFTNVYRNLDKVSVWINENWIAPHLEAPHLWFAMCVARLVNWPDTLMYLTPPVRAWHPASFVRVLHGLATMGKQVYSGAYMIRSAPGSKTVYLANDVLTPMWAKRAEIVPHTGTTLDQLHQRLMQHHGMGSFLAAQVVADLKQVPPLLHAADYWEWAASGPGSRRGANRLVGRAPAMPWDETEWLGVVQGLRNRLNDDLPEAWLQLDAQNTQNCLCEWEKYRRTQLGEGHPKAHYPGGTQ